MTTTIALTDTERAYLQGQPLGRPWPQPAVDPSGLRVLTIWARTRAGRALIAAVYHSSGHTWKIIGAREMRADQLAECAKWEERDE